MATLFGNEASENEAGKLHPATVMQITIELQSRFAEVSAQQSIRVTGFRG
jgi:hypothetical protein